MKKKRVIIILAILPILGVLLLVIGFKLQQAYPMFQGVRKVPDGGYIKCRYYLALRPSHIKSKVGGGLFSRVFHGDAVFYWKTGELRGKWQYVDGLRHGIVNTWHRDGRLRATWEAQKGVPVRGTLVAYTDEAETFFIQQGSNPRRHDNSNSSNKKRTEKR